MSFWPELSLFCAAIMIAQAEQQSCADKCVPKYNLGTRELLQPFQPQPFPLRRVAAGEWVIEQGSKTGCLFILIEGKVEIVKDDEVLVSSGRPGDIFGDLSALLDSPHTTSVRAVSDSTFHVAEDARHFLEQNPPVLMHLCELLARRLVSANDYLVTLKQQFEGHDHLGMVDKMLESLLHRHPRERVPSRSGADLQ